MNNIDHLGTIQCPAGKFWSWYSCGFYFVMYIIYILAKPKRKIAKEEGSNICFGGGGCWLWFVFGENVRSVVNKDKSSLSFARSCYIKWMREISSPRVFCCCPHGPPNGYQGLSLACRPHFENPACNPQDPRIPVSDSKGLWLFLNKLGCFDKSYFNIVTCVCMHC